LHGFPLKSETFNELAYVRNRTTSASGSLGRTRSLRFRYWHPIQPASLSSKGFSSASGAFKNVNMTDDQLYRRGVGVMLINAE
jgi:hypothetical protein